MTTGVGRLVCDITVTADGYAAGLNQTEQRPFGDDGSGRFRGPAACMDV